MLSETTFAKLNKNYIYTDIMVVSNSWNNFVFMLLFRFKCVALQYISKGSVYKNEDFAWMVGICPSDVAYSRNTELCENPGKDDLLETLIPVTYIGTNTHYRNKYCAHCSGLPDSALLVDWKVEIYNDIYLNIPDDNLLQKIRRNMGNIFYRPPDFIMLDYCTIGDSYFISSCNVSGKWLDIGFESWQNSFFLNVISLKVCVRGLSSPLPNQNIILDCNVMWLS